MTDGMAPEGLPEDVTAAIEAVMEKAQALSSVLDEHGYDAGTALIEIAKDELMEALRGEHEGESPC